MQNKKPSVGGSMHICYLLIHFLGNKLQVDLVVSHQATTFYFVVWNGFI